MTSVILKSDKDYGLWFIAEGHCKKEVCIAVSAFANAYTKYAEDFGEKHRSITTYVKRYESGNVCVRIELHAKGMFDEFMKGIDALITGIELYAANFPKEVEFINGSEHHCNNE